MHSPLGCITYSTVIGAGEALVAVALITEQGYSVAPVARSNEREYLMVYYNARRLYSTLGYKRPMEYEYHLNRVSGFC